MPWNKLRNRPSGRTAERDLRFRRRETTHSRCAHRLRRLRSAAFVACRLTAAIRALNVAADVERYSRIVEIPVIYDGEDMADVADLLGISVDEVVRRHCDTAWSVAFVGFAPVSHT